QELSRAWWSLWSGLRVMIAQATAAAIPGVAAICRPHPRALLRRPGFAGGLFREDRAGTLSETVVCLFVATSFSDFRSGSNCAERAVQTSPLVPTLPPRHSRS